MGKRELHHGHLDSFYVQKISKKSVHKLPRKRFMDKKLKVVKKWPKMLKNKQKSVQNDLKNWLGRNVTEKLLNHNRKNLLNISQKNPNNKPHKIELSLKTNLCPNNEAFE